MDDDGEVLELKAKSVFWYNAYRFFYEQSRCCDNRKYTGEKKVYLWHWWYSKLVYDAQSMILAYLRGSSPTKAIREFAFLQTYCLPRRFWNAYLGEREGVWRYQVKWKIRTWKARRDRNLSDDEALVRIAKLIMDNYNVDEGRAGRIAAYVVNDISNIEEFKVEVVKDFFERSHFWFWHDYVKRVS